MAPSARSHAAPASWPARVLRWCVRWRHGLGAVALVTVFALSSIPNTRPPRFLGIDKAEHVVEYFAVALLFLNVATRGFTRVQPVGLLGAWAGVVLTSLLDETYQRWIPGRSFDLWDTASSALGGLAAVVAVLLAYAVMVRPARRRARLDA